MGIAGKKFFAFSKFDQGASLCKTTWPGWFHSNPDEASWGCYVGTKTKEAVAEEHRGLLSMSGNEQLVQIMTSKIDNLGLSKEDVLPQKGYSSKPQASKMYQPEHELVARINARPKNTWKAKVYPEYEKMTQAEFNRMAGFRAAQSRPQKQHGESLIELDTSDLPKSFDWRNVDGNNYVDNVVQQACGSCYAVSTVSMINSRIRIMTKNREKPQLPYNQVLSCDRLNQGCAGGYPFLVEKYAQEFGLTKSGQCAKSATELRDLGEAAAGSDAYVRVKEFGYVGGYYGGTTTKQMMQELHANGPIVVGLNGGFELMHYESGVFVETGEGTGEGKIRNDFERVEHAVLAVGWGEDANGKQHWILKNSFGPGWGEHGYFRIPLGGDADGILSLVSAQTCAW